MAAHAPARTVVRDSLKGPLDVAVPSLRQGRREVRTLDKSLKNRKHLLDEALKIVNKAEITLGGT